MICVKTWLRGCIGSVKVHSIRMLILPFCSFSLASADQGGSNSRGGKLGPEPGLKSSGVWPALYMLVRIFLVSFIQSISCGCAFIAFDNCL